MPFPGMLHSPPLFRVFEPLLARISRCVQDMSAILVNFVHSPSFFSHAAKQRTLWTEFPCTLYLQHCPLHIVCR